jgi:hypothetical protein
MSRQRHGISIGIERVDREFFLTIKATGKLTHSDYETITPMLDGALEVVRNPLIKVLFDATELEGWELRAAWDDFKMGLKHNNHFVKIAVYGSQHWQHTAASIGSWFVSGEVKYFDDEQTALDWLHE